MQKGFKDTFTNQQFCLYEINQEKDCIYVAINIASKGRRVQFIKTRIFGSREDTI